MKKRSARKKIIDLKNNIRKFLRKIRKKKQMNHLQEIKFDDSCDALSGYDEESRALFSDFKKQVFEQLKGGSELSDFTLVRFLEADKHRKKGFNVKKSIERLKYTLDWREKYDVDNLRSARNLILSIRG